MAVNRGPGLLDAPPRAGHHEHLQAIQRSEIAGLAALQTPHPHLPPGPCQPLDAGNFSASLLVTGRVPPRQGPLAGACGKGRHGGRIPG